MVNLHTTFMSICYTPVINLSRRSVNIYSIFAILYKFFI